MKTTKNNRLAGRAATVLVALLWGLGLQAILAPSLPTAWITAGLLVAFIVIGLPRAQGHTKILCAMLALATAGLAWRYDQWGAVPEGISRATIFPAFLATIVLLRATADQTPALARARALFAGLDKDRRDGGIVVGAHLVGSVLQVGVYAVLAPMLARNATPDDRRALFLTATRGMGLVPFWSPFIVAMGFASQYLPLVPLWQIMSLGLFLTCLCLLISITAFDKAGGIREAGRALGIFAPLAPPIALATILVVGTAGVAGFSTLQSLIVALPLPCLAAVWHAGGLRGTLARTARDIGRIGPEISLLTFALTLGAVFEAALPGTGVADWLTSLSLSSPAIVFSIVIGMSLFGFAGVHPIVSGTVVLVLFTGIHTGLSDLVLMQAVLCGWGLSTIISLGSLSIATGATMFNLPPASLITPLNGLYVAICSLVAATVLSLLNPLIMG